MTPGNPAHTRQAEHRLRKLLSILPPSGMDSLREVLTSVADRLNEPMQLAIVGKISSSKSTLVNALLGKPELMATGQKEMTFNVGVLRHGDPNDPVTIHYRDGSAKQMPREQFLALSTLEEANDVSHIELCDDAEILKEINIIDTPGLDAMRGRDSLNTLEYIRNHRPDAVIMLFTHSTSESVLDVIRQYHASDAFNPINAIGVLAKIDVLWQELMPRPADALTPARKSVARQMERDAELRRTLYDMFPVSSLLFLAASTVNAADIADVRECDNRALTQSLRTVKSFTEAELPLSPQRRKELLDKMGLYGLKVLADVLKEDPESDVNAVRRAFMEKSGANALAAVLKVHFAGRSRLIKMENAWHQITTAIRQMRLSPLSEAEKSVLKDVENEANAIFQGVRHEHDLLHLLKELYNQEFAPEDLGDGDVAGEIRRIAGESGQSAPAMLGEAPGTPYEQLLAKARSRENHWAREMSYEPDPILRKKIGIIKETYTNICRRLMEMKYSLELAQAFIYNNSDYEMQ